MTVELNVNFLLGRGNELFLDLVPTFSNQGFKNCSRTPKKTIFFKDKIKLQNNYII